MSTFGKVLAVLNLLGAAGLVYFASVDYARRQAWAHSFIRHEAVVTGVPLDEKELDSANQPMVERFSEDDLRNMFSSVGNPVKTQREEFDRVKRELDEKVSAAAQSKVMQTSVLSRILLHLTDAYHEREQLLACRVHFANDQAAQALKERCRLAVKTALAAPANPDLPEKSFAELFRAAFHSQAGEPAEAFLTLFLDGYRDPNRRELDRKAAGGVSVDAAFDSAVDRQRMALERRYQVALAEASGTSPDQEARKAPDLGAQKAAIARLLFGVAPFLAEDHVFSANGSAEDKQLLSNPPSFAEYQNRLVNTKAYKDRISRMLVVCGLRSTLGAFGDRTAGLRRLHDYVQGSLAQERQQFVADHGFVVELIREQGGLVKAEQNLINENKERLTAFETIVKERIAEITQVKEEYGKARATTAAEAKKLRDLTEQVLDLRLKIRSAIEANEKGEESIRQLEKQARDLDRRKGE
jgi:hypothetical protein